MTMSSTFYADKMCLNSEQTTFYVFECIDGSGSSGLAYLISMVQCWSPYLTCLFYLLQSWRFGLAGLISLLQYKKTGLAYMVSLLQSGEVRLVCIGCIPSVRNFQIGSVAKLQQSLVKPATVCGLQIINNSITV